MAVPVDDPDRIEMINESVREMCAAFSAHLNGIQARPRDAAAILGAVVGTILKAIPAEYQPPMRDAVVTYMDFVLNEVTS